MTLDEKLMIRPPARSAASGFAQRVERALEIDRDLAVEQRVVAVGDASPGA